MPWHVGHVGPRTLRRGRRGDGEHTAGDEAGDAGIERHDEGPFPSDLCGDLFTLSSTGILLGFATSVAAECAWVPTRSPMLLITPSTPASSSRCAPCRHVSPASGSYAACRRPRFWGLRNAAARQSARWLVLAGTVLVGACSWRFNLVAPSRFCSACSTATMRGAERSRVTLNLRQDDFRRPLVDPRNGSLARAAAAPGGSGLAARCA